MTMSPYSICGAGHDVRDGHICCCENLEAPPGFEPGVEVLQLDLARRFVSTSADLLNESAGIVFLSSAEECPSVL